MEEKHVLVNMPRGFDSSLEADLIEIAQVLSHELDHALGLDHDEMPCVLDLPVLWVEGLPLRLRKGKDRGDADHYERRIRQLTLLMDESWVPRELGSAFNGLK